MSSTRRRTGIVAALLLAGVVAASAPSGCAAAVPCELNSDCLVGYCVAGTCHMNCRDASRDCPPGYSCDDNAQCVPGSTTSSSGGGGTGGGGGPATTTSTGSPATTTSTGPSTTSTGPSTTSSTGSGTMGAHELDPCATDADCASPLLCRAMVPGGSQRCTRACTSQAGCMTGTRCTQLNGSMYCAGEDAGHACSAPAQCNFACLTTPGVAGYCTVTCNTGSDCPNGYGCMPISGTKVCVKAEEPCSSGSECTSACDVSTQMVVGGCTTKCTTASDCPQRAAGLTPWTCDGTGTCRRPPDVFGPLATASYPAQYACNAQSTVVNVCNDALHIDPDTFTVPPPPQVNCMATTTTDGFPKTDTCIDSCRYQGGCAFNTDNGFGSACVAIGNIGNARIGLCIPTGGGEVGAACSHDYDCVFAYCLNGKCSRDCTADGVCPGGTTCTPGGTPDVEGLPFKRCQ